MKIKCPHCNKAQLIDLELRSQKEFCQHCEKPFRLKTSIQIIKIIPLKKIQVKGRF